MDCRTLLLTAALSVAAAPAYAELETMGVLSFRSNTGLAAANEEQNEVSLFGRLRWYASDAHRLTLVARADHQSSDWEEPGEGNLPSRSNINERWHADDKTQVELREFYWDWTTPYAEVTVGKQQIVWGNADGLKVADVLNPQSFKQFVLLSYDESRIPLWSLRLQGYMLNDEVSWEIVGIPDTTYHDIPSQDAQYALTSPRVGSIPPGEEFEYIDVPMGYQLAQTSNGLLGLVPDALASLLNINDALIDTPDNIRVVYDTPKLALKNADYGLRLKGQVGAVAWSAFGFEHFNDDPIKTLDMSDTSDPFVVLSYARNTTFGGTLSMPMGSFMARCELRYDTDAVRLGINQTSDESLNTTPSKQGVLGLDWMGGNLFLTAQGVAFVQDETHAGFEEGREQYYGTWGARYSFDGLGGSVLETSGIASFRDGDGLARLAYKHAFESGISLTLFTDIFWGHHVGLLGQFDQRDRIGLHITKAI